MFHFRIQGISSKKEAKRAPLRTIVHIIGTAKKYRKLFSDYDICYINTVVCVSAILAIRGQRSAKGFIHVREIPTVFQSRIFAALLRYSRAEIIYNSHATATAFGVEGTIVYNGVRKVSVNVRSDKEKSATTRLLIIGRINPWKGQQFALNALSKYGKNIDAHIRIVGDTFPGYENLLNDLHLAASECTQRVDFVGFSKNTASEIAWSDFVLIPSVRPEPFGRVAVESYAAHRPVIASNGGGLREIVTHGVDGFLFEPSNEQDFVGTLRNAISLTEKQYQSMCSQAAYKYQDKFTEKRYRERMASVVSNALNGEVLPK